MPIQKNRVDGRVSLETLLSSPIFFFDLAPVLERAGATMLRNPSRLELVCNHCVKSITDIDHLVFADTGFYLIVSSCAEPQATQLASQISAALLKCFFGTADVSSEALRTLFRRPTSEEISGLVGERIEPDELAGSTPADTGGDEDDTRPSIRHAEASSTDPLVELAARGVHREDGFRFGFAPAHDLRRGLLSIFLCGAVRMHDGQFVSQRDDFESIGPRELPRVDQAMLLHSLAFGRRLKEAGVVAAVSTSVSFETLAWSKGRQFYQNALRATHSAENSLLVVKIDMIPPGTPSTRLVDLVACIKPYAKRVFVQLPDNGLSLIQEANLGAAGYVLSMRQGQTREEAVAQSMRLAKLCAIHGALSCLDRIPDMATAKRIQASGVRFGEGNIFKSRTFFEDAPPESIAAYEREVRELAAAA